MMKRLMWGAVVALLLVIVVAVPTAAQVVDDGPISIDALLTAAGAGVAAGIVAGFVELLKKVFPPLDARLSGASMAFVVTALLYIWAWLATGPDTADEQLSLIVAWLTCATAAVGIASATKHAAVQAGVAALKAPSTAQRAVESIASSGIGTVTETETVDGVVTVVSEKEVKTPPTP